MLSIRLPLRSAMTFAVMLDREEEQNMKGEGGSIIDGGGKAKDEEQNAINSSYMAATVSAKTAGTDVLTSATKLGIDFFDSRDIISAC